MVSHFTDGERKAKRGFIICSQSFTTLWQSQAWLRNTAPKLDSSSHTDCLFGLQSTSGNQHVWGLLCVETEEEQCVGTWPQEACILIRQGLTPT